MDTEEAGGRATAVLLVGHHGAPVPDGVTALAPARVGVADGDQSIRRWVADLPAQVDVVVVCPVEWRGDVAELVALRRGVDDADACVRARGVTDAVKIVHAGRVVGAVDRTSLTHVGPPVAVRRSVLVGAAAQVTLRDVAALTSRLVDGGSRVRVVGPTSPQSGGGAS